MKLSDEEKKAIETRTLERMNELTPEKVYYKMAGLYENLINRKKKQKWKN